MNEVLKALESSRREEESAHNEIHNELQDLIKLVHFINKRNTEKENV